VSFGKVRAAIKSSPFLHGALLPWVNVFRRVTDALDRREINRFRRHCLDLCRLVPEAVFVKVGANDGVTGDPCSDILLAHTSWRGLLIEPVPYCFERLRSTFGDSTRFLLEQVAIGKTHGKAPFYFVDQEAIRSRPNLPFFYDQLGSFDRNHILKHLDATLEPFIIEHEIEVCTLPEVLRRNGIRDVHLLHIDTEGYDYEILKTLNLADHAPMMIFVEHKHLSSIHKAEMRQLLALHGYSVRDCGGDYFALNEEASRRMKRQRSQELQWRVT
jgi:FkbM family methyltransferase